MKLINNTSPRGSLRVVWCICIVLLTFSQSKAQILFSESFNYPTGALLTANNWTALSGTGTNNITASSGNLLYAGSVGNGIGNKVPLLNNGQDVSRTFTNTSAPIYSSLIVNVSAANTAGDFFYSIGTSAAPATALGGKLFIRSNGAGFSFGVLRGTGGTPVYESVIRPFNTPIMVVLKYEIVTGTTNDAVKLYVNPSLSSEPTVADVQYSSAVGADASIFSAVALLQGTAANAPTLEVDGIAVGTTWNSVASGVYDFGDTPVAYDLTKDGVYAPAGHRFLTGLSLGSAAPDLEISPLSVASGSDDNGSNGDGVDEDAIVASANIIRTGAPYSLTFPVNNPTAAAKYLYGWIDFNDDGKFQVEELANAVVQVTATGSTTQTLTWSTAKTATIVPSAARLYLRLRLSDRSLADFVTTASGGALIDERSVGNGATSLTNATDFSTSSNGEVEDYQITVLHTFDYGDVPSSYENDKDGNPLPGLHAPLSGFTLGTLLDVEDNPASVAASNENNTGGDNGVGQVDEDGISSVSSVSRGVAYSIVVPVNIPTTLSNTKYLFGWLDLNGDGRFQAGEVATTSTILTAGGYLTLTWTAAQTAAIVSGTTKIYLRLRLSNLNLVDFTTAASGGAVIDERSIGNGATTNFNAANSLVAAYGEVEDYQLPVDLYDFGDTPVSYESNNASASVPCRQITNPLYFIGSIVDNEAAAQNVPSGNDNNGTNGDGIDEDGVTGVVPSITKSAPFSFSVPIRADAASNSIAWIDFNNNGRFEVSEVAYTASTGAGTGYQSVPVGSSLVTFWFRGAQTNLIPAGINNLYVRIRLTQTTGSDNAATTAVDERSIADGASTGVYTFSSVGEVEDYRFAVGNSNYDFGDVPVSYEMDKDGTVNPTNFKPARNQPTILLHLGNNDTLEPAPFSVGAGNDNNGSNGDGTSDDGIQSSQLYIRSGAANTYTVAINNTTGAAATLYAWIDLNNNGRFESGEFETVPVASGAATANITFTAAQINTISSAVDKLYMRLRLVQPETGITLGDLTTGANNTVVDERSIADGLNTGLYGAVSQGEVEDYQLTVIRDYGDVPVSYENGSPASQTNSIAPELFMGATVDYELNNAAVAAAADNNGSNGDGLDEDGIAPQVITNGSPFTIKVPVNTTVNGTKNLYAWIDFNGDGIFNGNEAATASGNVTAGTTNEFTLTWPATATIVSPLVLIAGKTFVRFRLSGATITNTNNAVPVLIDTRSTGFSSAAGEIEDYQFTVSNLYDYGDAPAAYSRARDGITSVPARQASSPVLKLGNTIDIEAAEQSVAAGANNNGTNGDGADEDGIPSVMPVYKGTAYYSQVNVFNNSGSAKTLYAWIDLDNDGYFEVGEMSSLSVPSSNVMQTVTLPSWTIADTNTIPAGVTQVYMRLRISDGALADFTAGAPGLVVDERSIGDGLSTGVYGTANGGEIEDYVLPVVTSYDYGDAPDTYDTSRNNIVAPARHAASQGLYIGNNPADDENSKQIIAGNALGDDNSGIDDEDGVAVAPIYSGGGYTYSLSVKVTNNTGAIKTLYGWIDFNNNGRFENFEARTVSVVNGTDNGSVILTWPAASAVVTGTPSQLYMRLRLLEGIPTDFTLGAPGLLVDERALADGLNTGEYASTPVILNGEIEDYTIPVTSNLDYGDAPSSFEQNTSGVLLPARHISDENLIIGNTIDIEPAAQSVAAGSDNNGTNGDGLDEDGIITPLPTLLPGSEYSAQINVTNTLATAATLHAWIDMDGNGRFTSDEYTSVSLPANSGSQTAKLYWYATTYTGASSNTYMRVRITSASLTDNAATANVDERSIGDGLSTGVNAAFPINGETEDYYLSVDTTVAVAQPCDDIDNHLGFMDSVQALYHASIIRVATGGYLVFGNSANGNGSNQNTPAKVESGSNGFSFVGMPLMVTGVSYGTAYHQYFLLTTSGLYVWGAANGVFTNATTAMTRVVLPPGVGPANVEMMDAGRNFSTGSLMVLTKSGEVWVYSNTIGSDVQGDGNQAATGWHQVMINSSTSLTGMKDVRSSGSAAIATDGNNFYTWGTNTLLGDGQPASDRNFAAVMNTPAGISLPVTQQDVNNDGPTSYYLRDSAGKVFVMGDNSSGQLGLGNTTTATSWLPVSYINEQPDFPGVQTDITKPIGKVIWISANNHDAFAPLFYLVTQENRAYSAGDNSGNKSGVPSPTTRFIPTAATMGGGAQMLTGKMKYAEAGGHISILIKDRNDRYGYVGHTIDGSDGCGGCTNSPTEFTFTGPPSTGPVCGNTAFDYGDLDNRYNLGDQASHQIKYSQVDNPLKLGANAGDSDDGPQFTITGSGNNASDDDNDGKGSLIDEDAFVSGSLPVKAAGVAYTLNVPFTNNMGTTAYLYGSIDWNNNGSFEPGETIVKSVPASASQQTVALTWADPGSISGCNGDLLRSFIRLRLTTNQLSDDTGTPEDERSYLKADDGEVEDYYVDWTCGISSYCYKPGILTGTALDSKMGITSLSRAGSADSDNWPMVRKGAWLVLESKTKGFVTNRVAFDGSGNPVGIPAASFVEGMMVYDITNNCLKVYTSTDGGSTFSWQCFNTQACPD
ncbi:GEVED domain-containing protein [Chryseobacterium viscerum]|uniref:GEVED domain-containing protein n=1 Tax=Chryseobacterium viscerum TaxID=1037377 RepID=A0A5N4BJL3_9FLAO|nr:GEVED domain-containing protein [Chryseobacterium viscerum]KAB1228616.1 hypothetical protein F8D52_22040 [Chryseobacterium viscerum]